MTISTMKSTLPEEIPITPTMNQAAAETIAVAASRDADVSTRLT